MNQPQRDQSGWSERVRGEYAQALHNTSYHRPGEGVQGRMERLRESAQWFIGDLFDGTAGVEMPRERQMAVRAIEDALMYAIAGLARHGEGVES